MPDDKAKNGEGAHFKKKRDGVEAEVKMAANWFDVILCFPLFLRVASNLD